MSPIWSVVLEVVVAAVAVGAIPWAYRISNRVAKIEGIMELLVPFLTDGKTISFKRKRQE